ncbi:MAG: hypothetical protein ACJ8FH_02700 [Sphingomicrobium sp.]
MSFLLSKASKFVRSPGDPQVIETGPSSLKPADRAGRMLGWASFAIGATELFAPRAVTRWLGMDGRENLIRAYGAREVAAGVLCLSTNNDAGALSRVAGDALDLATLAGAYRKDNPKKRNVGWAMAAVAGIAIADAVAAASIRNLHKRKGPVRDYSDRSGFPKGREYSFGKAAQKPEPVDDFAAAPGAAEASNVTGETSPAALELTKTLEPAG